LLGSVSWLTHAPDWEPAIAVITTLAAFIALDIVAQRAVVRDEQRIVADRELFAKFRGMLPNEPTMRFFREHDYGGEFETDRHNPLHEFAHFCDTPDCHFLTPKLEEERVKVQEAVNAFRTACINRIFPGNHSGWCGVPAIGFIPVQVPLPTIDSKRRKTLSKGSRLSCTGSTSASLGLDEGCSMSPEPETPNQAMQPTAGRSAVSLYFMKTHPPHATLALASVG
jgi:hypothetical protein